jgi:hypothetical protein
MGKLKSADSGKFSLSLFFPRFLAPSGLKLPCNDIFCR